MRFINLECTISDQGGETVSPINKLVFTAPPPAAPALKRANIDIVSLANNHAWDYGKPALLETFTRLDKVGVAYVGAGLSREEAYAPKLVEHDGFTLAFIAVTDIWNQPFYPHPGKDHVADAELEPLLAAIEKAKAMKSVDKIIVSHHGGYEYVDQPHQASRELLRAAIEAGADAVIGHHPHVVQRVAIHQGKPILYSIGNLLMRMVTGKPWTEFGMLARLRFHRSKATEVEICPFHIFGFDPIPLADEGDRRAMYERTFRWTLDRLQRNGAIIAKDSGAIVGEFGDDGCAPVTPVP